MGDTSERPAQRRVRARIYTPSGWLTGTLHVLEDQPLLGFLEGDRGFFTLTDVKIPGQPQALPFLALQRRAAVLVVPSGDGPFSPPHDTPVRHAVSCLFAGGVLLGTLPLAEDVRVSDALMEAPGFFLLEDCTIAVDRPGAPPVAEAASHVFVHAPAILGVSEMN